MLYIQSGKKLKMVFNSECNNIIINLLKNRQRTDNSLRRKQPPSVVCKYKHGFWRGRIQQYLIFIRCVCNLLKTSANTKNRVCVFYKKASTQLMHSQWLKDRHFDICTKSSRCCCSRLDGNTCEIYCMNYAGFQVKNTRVEPNQRDKSRSVTRHITASCYGDRFYAAIAGVFRPVSSASRTLFPASHWHRMSPPSSAVHSSPFHSIQVSFSSGCTRLAVIACSGHI